MALCNSIQTVPIEKKRCKPCLNEGICFFKIDSNQMNSNLHDWNTWNWKLKCINHQFAHLTFYCCGKEKYILGRLTWLWHKITCCGRTNFSTICPKLVLTWSTKQLPQLLFYYFWGRDHGSNWKSNLLLLQKDEFQVKKLDYQSFHQRKRVKYTPVLLKIVYIYPSLYFRSIYTPPIILWYIYTPNFNRMTHVSLKIN